MPFIATGVGAVATQAFVNPFYGYRGLELLRDGAPAEDVVRILTAADDGREPSPGARHGSRRALRRLYRRRPASTGAGT